MFAEVLRILFAVKHLQLKQRKTDHLFCVFTGSFFFKSLWQIVEGGGDCTHAMAYENKYESVVEFKTNVT